MTLREYIVRPLVVLSATLISFVLATALPVCASCKEGACRILVVGDVGIGDDAFAAGFSAVQHAMVQDTPDLVLHTGDYIYTRHTCEWQAAAGDMPPYVATVHKQLVAPFHGQVVLAQGDNDAPEGDNDWAQAAHRCWKTIAGMGRPLTKPPGAGASEGVVEDLPGVFIAVLDPNALASDTLLAPDYWLWEPVKRAKNAGKWVLVVVHEPVVTTAWFEKPCCATLKSLQDMGVDLVFSGHQHSFERAYQLVVPAPPNQVQPVEAKDGALYQAGVYRAGAGVVYVVTGGGGAWLRPFADQQNSPPVGVVAPEYIRRAVARRASMNHYVRVDVEADRVGVTTMRVCASGEARWKLADTNVWPGGLFMLECHGKPLGVAVFDHFELRKSP